MRVTVDCAEVRVIVDWVEVRVIVNCAEVKIERKIEESAKVNEDE